MSAITPEFKELFMKDKFLYDSLSQAIKLAKTNGLNDKQIKPLTMAKQELKTKCAKNNEKLLRGMPLSENIVHLQDSWYAIRHTNDKGDITVKQECLRSEDIHIIKRDGRHENELRRTQLDDFLPAIQSAEALEIYKEQIKSNGHSLVYDHTGVLIQGEHVQSTAEEVEEEKVTTVSSHAGMRWVQRVMNHATKDDKKAEEYRRMHLQVINTGILDSFGKAHQVWQSDRDGITYWFDETANMMFVVGSNNIITLYEEDFGFTPDMNRMIVQEQLKVLAQVHDALRQAEDNHEKGIRLLEGEIKAINDELSILEAQMGLLVAKRATMNAEREQNSKEVKLARARYDVEFDKLFKKWDV